MLTPAQAALIKAEIQADPVLSLKPANGQGDSEIADALNLLASPNFPVWRTDVLVSAIYDAINWALYTPANISSDAELNNALACDRATVRLMVIQTKQLNLQNMTMGRLALDTSRANVRDGLRDAVVQIPSGASGAMTAPGGVQGATVLNACVRLATRAEKVLVAQLNQTTGTVVASILGFEGEISIQEVNQARNA